MRNTTLYYCCNHGHVKTCIKTIYSNKCKKKQQTRRGRARMFKVTGKRWSEKNIYNKKGLICFQYSLFIASWQAYINVQHLNKNRKILFIYGTSVIVNFLFFGGDVLEIVHLLGYWAWKSIDYESVYSCLLAATWLPQPKFSHKASHISVTQSAFVSH